MDLEVPFLKACACDTTIQNRLLGALVEVVIDDDG